MATRTTNFKNVPKYDIPFTEAIKLLTEGKWIKGDNFSKGCYLKCTEEDGMMLINVSDTGFTTKIAFNRLNSLSRQKFRIIDFVTVKELSK